MPIKSYLVHPHEGQKDLLVTTLSNMEQCEVLPAQNENIVILVTDTPSEEAEEILHQKINAISSLKLLAMVSGFNTHENN